MTYFTGKNFPVGKTKFAVFIGIFPVITFLHPVNSFCCNCFPLTDEVRHYFGEMVAMYFAFLGFYTMALVPPALAGLLCSFASFDTITVRLFFAVFNLVWATLFLEAWKLQSSTLAYSWGTIKSEQFEEARAAYHGELGVNQVTGRLEPKYPKWKRQLKFYCVSLPIVILCLKVAFVVMLIYFYWEQKAIAYYNENKDIGGFILVNVPSAIYAVAIILMNAVYRKLAITLNDWGKWARK